MDSLHPGSHDAVTPHASGRAFAVFRMIDLLIGVLFYEGLQADQKMGRARYQSDTYSRYAVTLAQYDAPQCTLQWEQLDMRPVPWR